MTDSFSRHGRETDRDYTWRRIRKWTVQSRDMPLLQVTVVRSELEKLKKEHEKLKAELSKVRSFTCSGRAR